MIKPNLVVSSVEVNERMKREYNCGSNGVMPSVRRLRGRRVLIPLARWVHKISACAMVAGFVEVWLKSG